MALLKAARVADVPTLDVVPDLAGVSPARILEVDAAVKRAGAAGDRFAVIGHRGKGMNALASPDRRLQEVKENSVRSFNEAARFPVDYVEFDVQSSTQATHTTRSLTVCPRSKASRRKLLRICDHHTSMYLQMRAPTPTIQSCGKCFTGREWPWKGVLMSICLIEKIGRRKTDPLWFE